MTSTAAPEPEVAYVRTTVRTSKDFTVTGAPDTRGPRKHSITVRPEAVRLSFRDGRLTGLSVRGRTVRADGEVTKYRDVGFNGYESFGVDPLPDWVAGILAAEGLQWPGGVDTNACTTCRAAEKPDPR